MTDKDKEFVDNLAAVQNETGDVTLSTGVVLRGKQAPPLILISIMAKYPRPKPPVYHSRELGRSIEHPDDPDYLEQVKSWQASSSTAVLNAMIVLGTYVVSVPKKFPTHKSDEWLKEYSVLDMDMFPENESWRYLTWVKLKAAPADSDLVKIREVVSRLSGVPETDVQAAETFSGSDSSNRGT